MPPPSRPLPHRSTCSLRGWIPSTRPPRAYRLDRILAESYRVQAYVKAAEIIARPPPGELEARPRAAGTLTELPVIGLKTAAIITQALDGGPIPYLEELEASTAITDQRAWRRRAPGRHQGRLATPTRRGPTAARPIEDDGRGGRRPSATSGWCSPTTRPASPIANGLSAEPAAWPQLAEVAALNEELAPFRILTGMEVDILEDGTLDLSRRPAGPSSTSWSPASTRSCACRPRR